MQMPVELVVLFGATSWADRNKSVAAQECLITKSFEMDLDSTSST